MIRLCEPEIGDAEIESVSNVLKSGYLVQGKYVRKFEERIEKYLNVKHAVAVSSGTAALHLALISLDIGRGDEVIVPDFTFPATANVVELVGAKPVFVDIDPETLSIDASKIESRINSNTKAIIPVHEFGQPANMSEIMKISKKYGIKVIEDAACALGACFINNYAGTIGDIGCFSLHPRKAITTGEGGIIVTKDSVIAEKLQILRNHGISSVDGTIDFVAAGFNYRLTDIQGAIGCIQIEKLDDIIKRRREIAQLYYRGLKNNNKLSLPVYGRNRNHIFQTFYVMLSNALDRDTIIKGLREHGIESNYGAYALHSLSFYRNKYSYDPSEYINTTVACKHGLALPLHSRMSNEDAEFVIDKLNLITGCI